MSWGDVSITPGAGANIAVDPVSGVDIQVVKLDLGAAGASSPALADGSGYLKVSVAAAPGVVTVNNPTAANLKVDASGAAVPITDNSGSLTVDAPVGTPAFVRLSDGTNPIATLPVSGTVTSNQGTGAAPSSAWPIKISDGTNTAPLDGSNGNALKVSVVASVGPGALDDGGTFTEGTTPVTPIAGEYTTAPASPSSGQAAAVQITQKRGLHINPRNAAGAEIGTAASPLFVSPATSPNPQPVSGTVTATLGATTNAGATAKTSDYDTGAGTDTVTMMGIALPANGGAVQGGTALDPVRTDPTGTTTQPVNVAQVGGNAVSTVANGVQKVALADSSGAPIGNTDPLPTTRRGLGETRVTNAVAMIASQTAAAIWTPASGHKFNLRKATITIVTSGTLKIFDGTNAAANMIYQGTPPVGATFEIHFHEPFNSTANNNVMAYTSGSGLTGDIVTHGYEV